ncbi:MAG: SRPBCC domain-containing protein [Planctomycetes bacterium]|nr:SRPBCC domain-containing protein [Planctomycetota bacterium]
MAPMTRPDDVPADRLIETTRIVAAPRELVWQVWSDPQHLAQWWGPTGFTTTTKEFDLRVGGQWRFTMHGPDGHDYENRVTFLAVEAPARLVYRHGGGKDVEPIDFTSTVSFEPVPGEPGKTRVTLRAVFPNANAREFVIRTYDAAEGGKQTLGRLAAHVEALATNATAGASAPFRIARVVRAPRELVWQVWTDREHLAQWFGPKGCTLTVEEFDLRPGGRVLYTMHWKGAGAMRGKWTIREVQSPERLVFVTSFAGANGETVRAPFADQWPLEMLSVVTFEPHAGKGKGTVVALQTTALGADAAEQKVFDDGHASMTGGWGGTFEQLEGYLARLG